MNNLIDVLGIGGAIVDILTYVQDSFLEKEKLEKRSVRLVDATEMARLRTLIGQTEEISGGCSANTSIGMAALGGNACFVGKVGGDKLGHLFRQDMARQNVEFSTYNINCDTPTGQCIVLITPDGERTMNTFLGASVHLTQTDIVEEQIASASVTFTEGYLFNTPYARVILDKIIPTIRSAGKRLAIGLSAMSCVNRWRTELLELIRSRSVDMVFGNRDEVLSLYKTENFESAISQLQNEGVLAAVTLAEQGSMVLVNGNVISVPAHSVERVVDATGAGDFFAAGFLYGVSYGMPYTISARLGSIIAAEAISHIGTRPMTELRELARQNGFVLPQRTK